jgi:alpha-tubulin suppressor-like RCC1 family protein
MFQRKYYHIYLIVCLTVLSLVFSATTNNSAATASSVQLVGWGKFEPTNWLVPYDVDRVIGVFNGGYAYLKTNGSIGLIGEFDTQLKNFIINLRNVKQIIGAGTLSVLHTDGTVSEFNPDPYRVIPMPVGLKGVRQIAVGDYFTFALKQDGSLVRWGNDEEGLIEAPVDIGVVSFIAAGNRYVLAIKSDGSIKSWGGLDTGHVLPPADLPKLRIIRVCRNFVLALTIDGSIVTWGTNSSVKNIPTGMHDIVDIQCTGYKALALQSDGALITWGDVPAGSTDYEVTSATGVSSVLTNNWTAVVQTGSAVKFLGYPLKLLSGPVADAKSVYTGDNNAVILRSNGSLIAFGSNLYGMSNVPSGLSGVKDIAIGGAHVLALKSDGTVVGWGYNGSRQLNIPYRLSDVISISAFGAYSAALKRDGTAYIWGERQNTLSFGSNAKTISIAGDFDYGVAVLNSNGTVQTWQSDSLYDWPTTTASLKNVRKISRGYYLNFALLDNGTLMCWGACSPDGSMKKLPFANVESMSTYYSGVIVSSTDGKIRRWDLDTGFANLTKFDKISQVSGNTVNGVGLRNPTYITPTHSKTRTRTSTPTPTPTSTATPTRTRTHTPTPLLIPSNLSFENGKSGWTTTSSTSKQLILRIPALAKDGQWLAVLGGINNETSIIKQKMRIPVDAKKITVAYKITSLEVCGYFRDTARVVINNNESWKLDACTFQSTSDWQSIVVDVEQLAGAAITIAFEYKGNRTTPSSWFIDQLEFTR